jgi:molybdopterin biosynthesis enzyme
LGLAASIGLAQLSGGARPRVALFSTGDELVMPGDVPPEQMPPGAIYNSNRFFLRACCSAWVARSATWASCPTGAMPPWRALRRRRPP